MGSLQVNDLTGMNSQLQADYESASAAVSALKEDRDAADVRVRFLEDELRNVVEEAANASVRASFIQNSTSLSLSITVSSGKPGLLGAFNAGVL